MTLELSYLLKKAVPIYLEQLFYIEYYMRAFSFMIAALSVFSQGTSKSVRPK